MRAKVKNYIQKFNMIEPHDRVIVGVSGGADSVCLLFLLYQFSKEIPFSITAVHVNHMIRKSAERDERFVQELCARWQIPCVVARIEVEALAKREGLTVEEAGRQARFSVFYQKKAELQAHKIALAHHRDDQAETVLFHMSRGCGIEGLVGIRPVREDIIHPLLCAGRDEIEAFLQKEGLDFVTDETNADVVYRRNILRHKVLPVLSGEICSEAAEHIAKTADICFEASDFLRQQIHISCETVLLDKTDSDNHSGILISEEILRLHSYMQKGVIHEALERAAGKRKDIGAVHILSVLALFEKQTGRSVNLPYHITAQRTYDGVLLMKTTNQKAVLPCSTEVLTIPIEELGQEHNITKEYVLADGKILSLRAFSYEKTNAIPQKTYTKWFDYDKINGHLTLRTRQPGDYFYLDDRKRQTVKAYMINNKIPQEERGNILMLAREEHVLWMAGYRISSFYKVSEHTCRVLEVTVHMPTDAQGQSEQ